MSLMQECPRCGFTQPEDRFCANCGLDIENYNPVPKTFVQKLLENDLLKISVMLTIGLALIFGFYRQTSDRLQSEMEIEGEVATESRPNEAVAKVETAPTQSSNYKPQSLGQKKENAPTPNEKPIEVAPIKPKVVTPPKVDLTQASLSLKVSAYEIATPKLKSLVDEGQVVSEGALMQYIATSKTNSISPTGDQRLSSFSSTFSDERPYFWEFMKTVEGFQEPIGVTYRFAITEKEAQVVTLEIMGYYNVLEPDSGQMLNQEFQSRIKISANSPVVGIGFLPRQSISAELQEVFEGTPLEILSSPTFLEGSSDYMLVLELTAN